MLGSGYEVPKGKPKPIGKTQQATCASFSERHFEFFNKHLRDDFCWVINVELD
jgi:hypothetical protein